MKTIKRLGMRPLIAALLLSAVVLPVAGGEGGKPDKDRHGKARLAPDLMESAKDALPDDQVRLVAVPKVSGAASVAAQFALMGGTVEAVLPEVNQIVGSIPRRYLSALVEMRDLEYAAPDRVVFGLGSHIQVTTGAGQLVSLTGPGSGMPPPAPGSASFDGSGVGVAVLDSGVDPKHRALKDDGEKRRMILSFDFTPGHEGNDPFGHGTHVAGIISGESSSNPKAGPDYSGIAPGAPIISLRVLDRYGRGSIGSVVAAIDFAVAYRRALNIRVLNLSLAAPPVDSYVDDPLCRAVERAAQAGLVVVAAAGNFGLDLNGNRVYGGITSPGNSPSAITVGAVDSHGSDARSDDKVAPFSSRGPTRSHSTDPVTGEAVYDNLPKPDLVAPGVRIVSLESPDNMIVRAYPELHVGTGKGDRGGRYMILSGSSMSAAMVSGAAALVLQANPALSPSLVKAILMYSAQILDGANLFEQGAGLLNVDGAVRLALALRQSGAVMPAADLPPAPDLPLPESTIVGETFAWSQGLIWGRSWVTGRGVLDASQEVYAQSLIWGLIRDVWGIGATCSGGLFSDSYVVSGRNGGWAHIAWDDGTLLENGMIRREELYASGDPWSNALIIESFYTVDPSGIIWGFGYSGYDSSLIWGLTRTDW